MSNSPLINVRVMSPNHSGRRTHKISKIAIHHMAGALTAQTCGAWFQQRRAQASSNYGVGVDGKIGLYVDEANRSWATASGWCDNRAVTIEVANSKRGGNWPVSDYVLSRTIDLVYDICKRNNIYPCTYTGDTNGVLQKHEWYANTNCPGPYLGSKFKHIATEVTRRLEADRKKISAPVKSVKPVTVVKQSLMKESNKGNIGNFYYPGKQIIVRDKAGEGGKVIGYLYNSATREMSERRGAWGKLKWFEGWTALKFFEQIIETRVVKSEKLQVRENPDNNGKKLKVLNKGDKLYVFKQTEAWVRTQHGWVAKRFTEVVR